MNEEDLPRHPLLTLVQGGDRLYNFERIGVVFEEEMLDWKYFAELPLAAQQKKRSEQVIIKNALVALTLLHPFETRVSIGVNKEKKELYFACRTFAQIYLGKEKVLSFVHDSRKHHVRYNSLLDWPELGQLAPYETVAAQEKDQDRIIGKLLTWTVDDWSKFFKRKLKERAYQMKKGDSEKILACF